MHTKTKHVRLVQLKMIFGSNHFMEDELLVESCRKGPVGERKQIIGEYQTCFSTELDIIFRVQQKEIVRR